MQQNPFYKFLAFFAITFVLSSIFTYVGPWWLIIIAPLLLGFFFKITQFHAFLMGGFSIIIYWGFLFILLAVKTGDSIIERVAFLLPLQGSKPGLIILTLLIGGVLGGLAALNGAFWRKSMLLKYR
jgi:hypothetical protein